MELLNNIIYERNTPCFAYIEDKIMENIKAFKEVIGEEKCKLFFPLKSFSLVEALKIMEPLLDGFAVSSVFEARLVKEIVDSNKAIQFTSPSLKPSEFRDVNVLCNYIIFNSLSQYDRYSNDVHSKGNIGIRINPQISFIKDIRYDPCRPHSKLGVTLEELRNINIDALNINGILFHNNCESDDYEQLFKTMKHIESIIPRLLKKLEWINIGGGYLFKNSKNVELLTETIRYLKNTYDLDVFTEPGKAIIGEACYMITSVTDIMKHNAKMVAILDTTSNHMPEIFEYGFQPEIIEESAESKHTYILAGASCLAGDIIGEYSFRHPIEIGDRISIKNMGAYTLVKANMFNGINLPNIYKIKRNGEIKLIKQFNFNEYLSRCGSA